MNILTSPKSKALVANNEGSSNSAGQSSNKGKGKNQKWKKNKSEDVEKKTPQSNHKGLPQINFSHSECSTNLVDIHPEGKLQGKSSRAPISLQMVHMVLAGPFAVNKGCYILTFIDDFSRYT